jgi:serine/threonine protein kinase
LSLIRIVVLAHRDAWESSGVLHRDISTSNIMIDILSPVDTPKAFLNDWDLSKFKEDLFGPGTQLGRSVSILALDLTESDSKLNL